MNGNQWFVVGLTIVLGLVAFFIVLTLVLGANVRRGDDHRHKEKQQQIRQCRNMKGEAEQTLCLTITDW